MTTLEAKNPQKGILAKIGHFCKFDKIRPKWPFPGIIFDIFDSGKNDQKFLYKEETLVGLVSFLIRIKNDQKWLARVILWFR